MRYLFPAEAFAFSCNWGKGDGHDALYRKYEEKYRSPCCKSGHILSRYREFFFPTSFFRYRCRGTHMTFAFK
jgi:hypothetical protein